MLFPLLTHLTSVGKEVSDPNLAYVNVCPFGEPLLDEDTKKPRLCSFKNKEKDCGDLHWCHLGLIEEENQCCPGEPREIAACESRVTAESGISGPEGIEPVQRWAYVSSEGVCTNFTFNGRKGNSNSFETETDCLSFCGGL